MWTGLTWSMALLPVLSAFGLNGSPLLVLVGAVLMVVGCVLMWLSKE